MVGEGVLQIVISEPKTEWGPETILGDGPYNVSILSGFVLSICMLYSFNITEPHHARGHAFARSSRPAALYLLLLPPKALSILLVGIGIKMVLYTPLAPLIPALAFEQRLFLSVSLAMCFALQLIRQPLHVVGFLDYYSLKRLRRNRTLACTLGLRLALIGLMIASSVLEDLLPWQFMGLQAIMACAFCALHFTELKLPVKDVKGFIARHSSISPRWSGIRSASKNHASIGRNITGGGGGGKSGRGPRSTSIAQAVVHAARGGGPRKGPNGQQRNRKKASCMCGAFGSFDKHGMKKHPPAQADHRSTSLHGHAPSFPDVTSPPVASPLDSGRRSSSSRPRYSQRPACETVNSGEVLDNDDAAMASAA